MELQGIFLKASEVQTFESGYQNQEFYLDASTFDQFTGEKRANTLRFQIGGDRISYLNGLKNGDRVKVFFTIKGQFYEKKDGTGKAHFQNLNAYKVEVLESSKPTTTSNQAVAPRTLKEEVEEEDDDLPF